MTEATSRWLLSCTSIRSFAVVNLLCRRTKLTAPRLGAEGFFLDSTQSLLSLFRVPAKAGIRALRIRIFPHHPRIPASATMPGRSLLLKTRDFTILEQIQNPMMHTYY